MPPTLHILPILQKGYAAITEEKRGNELIDFVHFESVCPLEEVGEPKWDLDVLRSSSAIQGYRLKNRCMPIWWKPIRKDALAEECPNDPQFARQLTRIVPWGGSRLPIEYLRYPQDALTRRVIMNVERVKVDDTIHSAYRIATWSGGRVSTLREGAHDIAEAIEFAVENNIMIYMGRANSIPSSSTTIYQNLFKKLDLCNPMMAFGDTDNGFQKRVAKEKSNQHIKAFGSLDGEEFSGVARLHLKESVDEVAVDLIRILPNYDPETLTDAPDELIIPLGRFLTTDPRLRLYLNL